jgi:hypoxanthine phosphoribosyltransferase
MNYLPISWNRLQGDMAKLADAIIAGGVKYDSIVAIARGGLTVAHMLSDFLSLPVMTLTISSYMDTRQQHTPRVIYDVGASLYGKHILMVDDISDTGDTLALATNYAHNRDCALIHTAAPYIKSHTHHIPDYYVDTIDDWVIYPYELKETIESLTRIWTVEGLKRQDCVRKLGELNFSADDIKKYMLR